MGYRWDIYGISMGQPRTGVKKIKMTRENYQKNEMMGWNVF